MATDSEMVEEVVVVGFGQQKRAQIVSSISNVAAAELKSPGTNISANLSGQIAGLISVQRTAEPGRDDAEFYIRGMGSYAGGNNPLVLVDGVPRDFTDIEVDEIESFSVLKDASATAIYGAEGGNGVLMITTKRGLISKPKVSFRAEHSLASPQRVPDFVDSWEYVQLANEANFNDMKDPYIPGPDQLLSVDDVVEKYRSGADPDLYPNSNWMDLLMRDVVQSQRYTLGFRGGAENAKYFVSMAYLDQNGVFKDNPFSQYNSDFGYQRYNLRANVDLRVSKTTRLGVNMAGQYVNRRTANRSPDDIFKFMLWTPPHLFPAVYSDGTLSSYRTQSDGNNRNPFNMLYNQGYRKEWETKLQTNVTVDQDLSFITQGLSATGKISFDYDSDQATLRNYWPELYNATGRDSDGNLIYATVLGDGSDYLVYPTLEAENFRRRIYIEGQINYRKTIDRHDMGASLIYYQKEDQDDDPVLPMRKQHIAGRVTYSFDNRYFFEGNFGYTGSAQWAPGHRWGLFPAVGVSWYLSNEEFYPASLKKVMNSFKLRVSAGKTGNDETNLGQFPFRPTFNQGGFNWNQAIMSGSANNIGAGIRDDRPANWSLGWEESVKRNIGLDLAFWNNSVELTVDYFNDHRSRIVNARNSISNLLGLHTVPNINYGEMKNRGFDASLTSRRKFGDWTLSARGTFTYAHNTIVQDDSFVETGYAYQNRVGHSGSAPFVYIAERLYTEDDFTRTQLANGTYDYVLKPGLPVVTLAGNDFLGPGDIKFADYNNDGLIDTNDMVRGVGHPTFPEINYGFGFNVDWKGISLGMFFQGVANATIIMTQTSQTYRSTIPFSWGVDKGNYRRAFLDRWTAENPSQDVVMPRLHTNYANDPGGREPNTWWMRNGNFLRFKNLEISYTLPERITDKIGMDNFRVYLLGQNLGVWDQLKMWDPEQGARNVAGMNYPLSRTFTLGVEFNL
jgi:TonB-linked SusC/RagA family outer membrane protein